MSTFAYARLILLKDLRTMRQPLILLLLLMASLTFLLPTGLNNGESYAITIPYVIVGVLWVSFGVMIVQLVLLDPTAREFRFLLTRPIPGLAIGWAKGLFLFLFLYLPGLAVVEIIAAKAGISLSLLDHISLAIENMAWWGLFAGVLALLGAFLQKGSWVLFFIVGAVLIWVTFLAVTQAYLFHPAKPYFPTPEQQRWNALASLLLVILLAAMAFFSLGWRYASRSFKLPLAIFLSSFLLIYAVGAIPRNVVQWLRSPVDAQALPLTREQLDRIHFVLQPGQQTSGSRSNTISYVNYNKQVRLEGVEAPYYVRTLDYNATVTLKSGEVITSNYTDYPGHGGAGGLTETMKIKAAGLKPRWQESNTPSFDLFTCSTSSLPKNGDLTGATIKGTITLDIRRLFVAHVLPLRTGAIWSARRSAYQVISANPGAKSVSFVALRFRIPLVLRGDLASWNQRELYDPIAVYRPANVVLNAEGGSFTSNNVMGMSIDVFSNSYGVGNIYPPLQHPLPPDWASETELVFLDSASCGQVTLPYEVHDANLTYHF